jgi:fibronectin type 3 domain-containing protein
MNRVFSSVAFLCLTGCGYPGPVLPPLLDIPLAIPYVNAVEYGDKILVEFTLPDLTTEGNPLRNVRSLEVGVGPGPSPFTTERWAETAKRYPVASPAPGPFTREIPVADWVNQNVVISARAVGPKGKPAQWATVKLLTVQPVLPEPTGVDAKNVEQGVKLTWKGTTAPKYRIFRAIGDTPPERLAESDHPEFVDDTTEYDKTYRYLVQAITDDFHGSKVSAPASVTTKDEFAPAVPGALTAVLGVNTVELAWTRNTEKDFRGYNVYRSTDGGPFEKIADLVPAPTFSDNKIEAGKKYRYAVTSVDLKGNESAHSTPADASNQ